VLEVKDISFAYPGRPVLGGVTFSVSPGEVVAVVGANGVGKTTLLRVLAMLAAPDRGTVRLDGQDAFGRPIRYLRQVGYLPEKPALYEDMTVKGYLKYRAALKGELSKRMRRRIGEAVELAGLGGEIRTPVRLLSAGMKKRVALADAFLLRPRVLLLDDFLAGIDRDMRRSVGELLAGAAAFSSVVVTGHELDDFVKWTTRFLVLKNGAVAADMPVAGRPEDELRRELDRAMAGRCDR
jgi:ABC-2 type transport system ATP-binding protein